jgi:hypothetical protein
VFIILFFVAGFLSFLFEGQKDVKILLSIGENKPAFPQEQICKKTAFWNAGFFNNINFRPRAY